MMNSMSRAPLWWLFEVRPGIDTATSCFVLETNDQFMELNFSFMVSVFCFVSKKKKMWDRKGSFTPQPLQLETFSLIDLESFFGGQVTTSVFT